MDLGTLLFSPKGRLNRSSYIIANIVLYVMIYVFKAIVHLFFGIKGAGHVLGIIVLIIGFIISVLLLIKRFHDFDKSGYYLLGFIVVTNISAAVLAGIIMMIAGEGAGLAALSLMALAILLYTFLKPGTDGVNQYGNQPAALFDLGLNDNVENINPVISDNSNN